MSVSVRNITKLYGSQKALDDVSFTVEAGSVVGFLGPNGAGKSTMMKIITCFIPQSIGEVEVCGYDVTEASLEVRKNVGYLPENNPLYTDMYIKEYLEFIAGLHHLSGSKSKRVAEMIDITGLGIEQHKKIGALSKGFRQRVGLAQALIHDPKVLILDEPTTGLDPNQLADIRQLIRTLGKEKTVILSTHIMQEVEAICDRVIIINHGKIVADGSTESLNTGNKAADIILVEFDKPADKNSILQINGISSAENISGNNWKISAQAGSDARATLFRYAVENDIGILSLQKQEQKLEDIFQQLTMKSGSKEEKIKPLQ
ncbi:MAG TPA: gliding motility-associated ABC transporter ATP-binding subunit GldA [Bacteroidia bacterium]|nr:gliding motility-associated ABC transporter ATP-binding subunit GldA [Bacteroidia bacterium]HNS13445.1 gliding motility-associated ABC transporter ATP-binding subunit GldA [Bacteroidia bacterium]